MFHLFSGATMFGAFFIITDPVSSAVSNRGRLIFGAGVGILVYLIRVNENYPDAVAFGVLLLNLRHRLSISTQPQVYGTKKIEVDGENRDFALSVRRLQHFAAVGSGLISGVYEQTKEPIAAAERAARSTTAVGHLPSSNTR